MHYIIYTVGIAIDFLSDHIDDIKKFGDGFALLVLELTRKVGRRVCLYMYLKVVCMSA